MKTSGRRLQVQVLQSRPLILEVWNSRSRCDREGEALLMSETTAPILRARDMMTIEDLFIRDGYVLRFSQGQTAFSDRTFAQFFREELNLDIDDPKWSLEGGSKGKRLRYFLRTVEAKVVIKTLK